MSVDATLTLGVERIELPRDDYGFEIRRLRLSLDISQPTFVEMIVETGKKAAKNFDQVTLRRIEQGSARPRRALINLIEDVLNKTLGEDKKTKNA